jgi:hypothetical protein
MNVLTIRYVRQPVADFENDEGNALGSGERVFQWKSCDRISARVTFRG